MGKSVKKKQPVKKKEEKPLGNNQMVVDVIFERLDNIDKRIDRFVQLLFNDTTV